MTTETTETTTTAIALTDVAAAKVAALLAQEGRDDLYLRVAVQQVDVQVFVTSSTSMSAIKKAISHVNTVP